MQRRPTFAVRSGGFLLGAVLAMTGMACGEPPPLFLSDGVSLPAGSACAVVESGIADLPVLGRGTLDLMVTNRYSLLVRYRNRQSDDLSLRSAFVKVDLGSFVPTTKDSASTKNLGIKYMIDGVDVAVSGGAIPGEWGVVEVPIVPEELGNVLDVKMQALVNRDALVQQVTVTATVTVEAKVAGDGTTRSNEFTFPVDLCWGCLVERTAAGVPAPCRPGQDDVVARDQCPFVARHPNACPQEAVDHPDGWDGDAAGGTDDRDW